MIQMARTKNPDTIPTTPGVYSIWEVHPGVEEGKWEECLYIGMASNLRNRINQHHLLLRYLRSRCEVKVQYKECPLNKLREVEAFMLSEHRPTLNRAFPASYQLDKIP